MITQTQRQLWYQRSKQETLEIAKKNVSTRCQQFEKIVNEAVTNVNYCLNLSTSNCPPYICPAQITQNCEIYLQWINKIKFPQTKQEDTEGSYNDMASKIMSRYNYMKSDHFADGLFPALFDDLFNYISHVSEQMLSEQSALKKQAYQSILTKLCCFRILEDKIADFHQTKPTPLICERSVKTKSRRLHQLLKQIINERQLNSVFPSISYDSFPQDSKSACLVLKTLGNEEIVEYLRMYDNDTNNQNNMLAIPNTTITNDTNENWAEQTCNNNFNDDNEDNKMEIKGTNTTQNFQKFGNRNMSMSISRDYNCSTNYTLQRNNNVGLEGVCFDPVFCSKEIMNEIFKLKKKLEMMEIFLGNNHQFWNNCKENTFICNRQNLATTCPSLSDKKMFSSTSNTFIPEIQQLSNLAPQELFSDNSFFYANGPYFNQINDDISIDGHITHENYINNEIAFNMSNVVNSVHVSSDDLCEKMSRQPNIDSLEALPIYENPTQDYDGTSSLFKNDNSYREIDFRFTNNENLWPPFLNKQTNTECKKTLNDNLTETIAGHFGQMKLYGSIHQE